MELCQQEAEHQQELAVQTALFVAVSAAALPVKIQGELQVCSWTCWLLAGQMRLASGLVGSDACQGWPGADQKHFLVVEAVAAVEAACQACETAHRAPQAWGLPAI